MNILLRAHDVSSYVPWVSPERMAEMVDPARPIRIDGALPIMGGLFYRLVNVGIAAIAELDRRRIWWGYDMPLAPIVPASGSDIGHLELLDQVALEQRMRGAP